MRETPLSLVDATQRLTAVGELFEMDTVNIRGISYRIWKNAPSTLRDVLRLSLKYAQSDFLVYENQRLTFEEHFELALRVAQGLAQQDIGPGDRVAIASRNLPEWVATFWGVLEAGAIVVPLNAWWTSDELSYALNDCGARALFVDDERLGRIVGDLGALPEVRSVVVYGTSDSAPTDNVAPERIVIQRFSEFVNNGDLDSRSPVASHPDDDATIFYTSGTTGRPKGAVGTHRNAVTNLMNLFFISQRTALRFGATNRDETGRRLPSASLLNVPLFHATGCLATMISNLASGGKLIMMHHFDARRALELIQSEKLTSIGGVPTIVMQLLDHPEFGAFDTSSVRSISYGGAPAPPELVRRLSRAFPQAQAGNGYGLTETSAAICVNSGADYVAKPDSCGVPVPVCDARIVPEGFTGDEPTPELPTGADVIGELWVKGPNVVRGYWNKPDATNATITKGWLHTGDIARIDDEGWIYIVDRAKDMIIRGGENIYCVIVEAAIFEHPDVADCTVIGLPHPTLGEEVVAVVVLRANSTLRADELSRHVSQRLAKFEVPTKFVFRSTDLPRNPQGKVLKRELRDSLIENHRAN